MLILQETRTRLTETSTILIIFGGVLLFTLIAVSASLYISMNNKKQYYKQLEQQETENMFLTQLMQSRLEFQEQTLKNMSAEMHDNIAQTLGAVKLQLHLLASEATSNEQKALADEAADTIREAIKEVRVISHVMNGAHTLRNGLRHCIETDLDRIVAAQRIKCNFTHAGQAQALDEGRETILYRIIQESIANAVRHGNPSTISVAMNYQPENLDVIIEDNGKGFDHAATRQHKGFGIANMEERMKLLNGTVHITSELNKGTKVQLNIPLLTT